MIPKTDLDNYLYYGMQAGCPRNQMERFVQSGYVALRWALPFHAAARAADLPNGPVMIGCGGARGPGKSHAILAQVGIDDCQRFPGLKWLFLRKVAKSAQESFEDLISRVFGHQPHKYTPSTGFLEFANGSRIRFGGFNHENDIDGYLGIQYDGIIIEEMTQLSERKVDMIRGSLRTSRPDWRPRLYGSTNPGGVGHGYYKRTFVQPYRNNQQDKTRFFPSTYKDNPFLNTEYRDYLEALPGMLGKAWRDGSWDVFEGQAFPIWNDDVHVVQPFEIPPHWLHIRAIDWGTAKPFCCLWMALDPDTSRVIVYRELYATGLSDRQQAQQILAMTPIYETIAMTYADPAMWSKRYLEDGGTTSTASTYAENGLTLTKADNSRLGGKRKVDRLLGMLPDGKPGLQVFTNCANTRRTMPELVYDNVHVEDVDTTGEDHAYDALKYGLTAIHEPVDPNRKKPQQQNPFMKLKRI